MITCGFATVGLATKGVSKAGPDQDTTAPTGAPAVKVNGLPTQTGLFVVGLDTGRGLTTTNVEPVQVVVPVAVTVYTPAIDALLLGIVTFGPVAV